MIRRKLVSISSNKFPCSNESLRKELYRVPMKDLYNVIYWTVKDSCRLNEFSFAETSSKSLATKIWSLAFEWQSVITGKTNAKQMVMGMIIHRITGSKLVILYLNLLNHTCPYKTILSDSSSKISIRNNVPLHSGIDHNDGRQETITGFGTTHHTNSLFFQTSIESDDHSRIQISTQPPGTREIKS